MNAPDAPSRSYCATDFMSSGRFVRACSSGVSAKYSRLAYSYAGGI